MRSSDERLGGLFGKWLFAMSIGVPLMIYDAFILTLLWRWYTVPTFGWRPLSTAEAFGVVLVLNYIVHKRGRDGDSSWESIFSAIVYALLYPAALLLIGFLLKGWIS